MTIVKKKVDYKDYKESPKSKMSKQVSITKPENRHPNTHNYSVSQAESKVKSFGSGK